MKVNMPITDREVRLRDDQVIVSKTDLKGRITYVNPDFVEISGFSEKELLGKSHNIVRHPHMPPEAFQDMWDTIRAGKPWSGLVKNRCKNGDFYWVNANVTPVFKNGSIVEYMSVRTAPTRDQIAAAEELYKAINNGKAKLGAKSWKQRLNFLGRMQIWQQITLTVGVLALVALGNWGLIQHTLRASNDSLQMAGNDRRVSEAVGEANMHVIESKASLLQAVANAGKRASAKDSEVLIEKRDKIAAHLNFIANADLGDEERAAADQFAKFVQAYTDKIITPAIALLKAGNRKKLQGLLGKEEESLYQQLVAARDRFMQIQTATSDRELQLGNANLRNANIISLVLIAGGILLAGALSFVVIHNLRQRLAATHEKVQQILEGNYFDWIATDNEDEIGRLLQGLKSMQIKLGFEVVDARQRADAMQRIKVALDNVSANVMMADNEGVIIYLNRALKEMLAKAQDEIRKDLPDFDVEALEGANIDAFHKHPEHQRKLLAGLKSTHKARIAIGGRTFDLIANPVINSKGERLGTTVEWQDVTEQLEAERQVETLIEGAIRGVLDERIDTASFGGFMKNLGEGINRLMDAIVNPLRETVRVLEALADGDLTHTMKGELEGEFAKLQDAINTSLANLQQMVGDIRSAADNVRTGAREISQGNTDLAQRTEEQASSLEETASTMEELTGTVKQNADNAMQANQLAAGAREQAEKGGRVVGDAVAAMEEINKSSKRIADIIGVIDDIAFQTNLLALNAAVEAARAGEQGRGFAVVATEVRKLAQRSAEAAKEIKDLIEDSVSKIEEGGKLVNASGDALNEIVIAVKKVSDIVAEIAAASEEQASGIEQVNKAVAQLDDVTHQNAALVEEAASASQSLEDQAQHLEELIGFFKLGGERAGSEVASKLAKEVVAKAKARSKDSQLAPARPKRPVAAQEDYEEWEEF